jgi:hypothetical protein
MTNSSMIRYIFSGLLGLVIAVVFTAVANLVKYDGNVWRTLIIACLSAVVSAFLGYILGASRKK